MNSIVLGYLTIAAAVGVVNTAINHYEYSKEPRRFLKTFIMFEMLGLLWLPSLVIWAADESRA